MYNLYLHQEETNNTSIPPHLLSLQPITHHHAPIHRHQNTPLIDIKTRLFINIKTRLFMDINTRRPQPTPSSPAPHPPPPYPPHAQAP